MKKIKRNVFYIIRNVIRFLYRKHIWLISDRESEAGDNGEVFFAFLQDKPVNSIFAVSKDSSDYKRMKEVGKVVAYGSFKHFILTCIADVNVSSHENHMRNHQETVQVFLQHGITMGDMNGYINPLCHDNFYIIASTEEEAKKLGDKPYKIKPGHVLLTGMPRYDLLEASESERIITIALTWRNYLYGKSDEEFRETEYCRILSDLLNDSHLRDVCEGAGYELMVVFHPQVKKYSNTINVPNYIKIWDEPYRQIFAKSSLLITDYSSVAYDFAYLNKPVIYYQEDIDEYSQKSASVRGVQDFKAEGLGEVTYTKEDLINCIQGYIKNKCKLEQKYKDKINQLFTYRDSDNCERVYEAIRKILVKNRFRCEANRYEK